MGHNSLDQPRADNYRSDLFERKYVILRRGAGPDVQFTNNNRFDKAATERHLKAPGLWSGTDLRDALESYYAERPEFDKNNLRNNLGYAFFLFAPQEYFASLSNQYYAHSELMLLFAVERAQE